MKKISVIYLCIIVAMAVSRYSNALWSDSLVIESNVYTGQWNIQTNQMEAIQDGVTDNISAGETRDETIDNNSIESEDYNSSNNITSIDLVDNENEITKYPESEITDEKGEDVE